eukprot:g13823.t1
MRVRHLQTHLADQGLVNSSKLSELRNTSVGIDAVFWLRSIQALKDPFADALGGIPPGMFGFVDKELDSFKEWGITPFFIFQGKCFAVSTSRINGDFVYFIFHHLRHRGYELLLYGVKSCAIHLNFGQQTFDWVDLDSVLQKWQLTWDEFVDACMLAGTEYCLTYPYLNLSHFQPQQQARFNFDAAVYIIKQAPLINWMQTFPTEDMKNDHVDGYCICKVLVQNSPVYHLGDVAVRPLGAKSNPTGAPPQVPSDRAGKGTDTSRSAGPTGGNWDFSAIMGNKLPPSLYYLMLNGIISHKLLGGQSQKSNSDTKRNGGANICGPGFRSFDDKHSPTSTEVDGPVQVIPRLPAEARVITPEISQGLRWKINGPAVKAEMQRQGVSKVDFKFCLQWHSYEFERDGPLMKGLTDAQPCTFDSDLHSLSALVHFMVLEKLDLISQEDGNATVLSDLLTLACIKRKLQRISGLGLLNGEPFEAAQPEKPFPEDVKYPIAANLSQPERDRICGKLLLCRVMSLVPMRLRPVMWDSDVDFDLAAFHTLVRALKRTLRQVVEGALAHVLLGDLSNVRILPKGFMCTSPDSWPTMPAEFPAFMLPRACMGIVVKYFLEYKGSDLEALKVEMGKRFPCCDMKLAFSFWDDLRRCVDSIAERSKAQLEANKKAKPAGPPKTGAKKASAAVEATKKTGPKMTEEEAKALFDKAQQRNKQAAAPAVSASRGGRFAAFGDESD